MRLPPLKEVRRVSAVVRVSRRNGRGADGSSFLSPEQQREVIERWCEARGVIIVSWHDETDSVSGKTTNRVGLQAAMTEALTGRSDGVIVAKLDRFSRSAIEGLLAIRELHHAGRAFVAVAQGIESLNPRDPNANLMLMMHLAMAQWLWETLTAGWADVVERHIAAGVANVCPWGYARGEDRRLTPDPSTAPWVARIFEWRAQGQSWTDIASMLNDEGIPSATGRLWTHSRISALVANRTYLGELRSGEVVNPSAHPALVSVDVFERANQRQKTARKAAEGYVLAGIVRCASCGGRMKGNTDGGYRYYRCRRTFGWGKCPMPVKVPADELEAMVLARFHEDYLSTARFEPQRSTDELTTAVEAVRAAEAEVRAFMTAPTTLRLRELMGEAAVEEGMSARLNAVAEAQELLAEVESQMVGAQLPADLAGIWPTMDTEDQRSLLTLVYPVVAVAHARQNRWHRVPVEERTRIWSAHEDGLPTDLPGLGNPSSHIRPIVVRGPGGARVAAG